MSFARNAGPGPVMIISTVRCFVEHLQRPKEGKIRPSLKID